MNISLSNNCNESDITFIRKKLIEYNTHNIGMEPIINHVHYVLRNDNNEIVGGISGIIYMDCLTIDLQWVSEELRGLGYGKKLLNEAEDIAKSRKCSMILLDTFSFQAPDFYKRNGFNVFSILENCPVKEVKRYYLKKDL